MRVSFSEIAIPRSGSYAVLAFEGPELSATARRLDKKLDGALSRAAKAARFTGKCGQIVEIVAPPLPGLNRLLMVGLGAADEVNERACQEAGGALVARLLTSGEKALAIAVESLPAGSRGLPEFAAHVAFGSRLRAYRFDRYRTRLEDEKKPTLARITVQAKNAAAARRAWAPLAKVADGVYFTRDLVSEPGNVIYPDSFARRLRGLSELGVKVEVLTETRLRKMGMGALLAVGQGSARESRVVVMHWNGARSKRAARPIALIGKGVTFDSGGISLKPGAGMAEMKWDMGGAGAVAGAMKALAGRRARVNVVGIVGLVENMPSGTAQRPGDIVKSLSGQTIEVLNTDAEGRLVLADVLWYARERFKPRAMIDLATLTGAMIVTLGHEKAGLFANDDELAEALIAAGETSGEPVWRFPLDAAYDKLIDSPVADVQNIGPAGQAGSITAAQFLQRFVGDTPWAHLDIAGMAWSKKDAPTVPKGGTGYGVRLLDRLIAEKFES